MYKVDPENKLVDSDGVLKPHVISLSKHNEDFFCAYLDHWDDFKAGDGSLMMVFRWCILASSVSVMGSEHEGNIFHVDNVKRIVEGKGYDMTHNTLKFQIHKLRSRGFIVPIKRGLYYINPKYGVKGSISDQKYRDIQDLIKFN